MEDHVIEAFLARIESRVDARVSQQLGVGGKAKEIIKEQGKHDGVEVAVIGASFALSIPLVAIAGGIAGSIGIVAVMFALVAVNLLYFIDRWVRFNLR